MSDTEVGRAGLPERSIAGRTRETARGRGDFFDRQRYFMVFMALPAVIYVILVGVWPLAQGAWYSLFDYNLQKPGRTHFVGLGNYFDMFADSSARAAIVNTFSFTVAGVAIELVLGLLIALMLWRDDRFNRVVLALLLIPSTITPLVVGLIFKGMLSPDFGIVGYWLTTHGIGPRGGLLADGHTALATLIFVDIWEWTPLTALILLAGLKALPNDVLEASRADGATTWQRFSWVILPLMLPSVFLALILRTMDAFRVFDSPFVTTGGGPGDATQTLMVIAVKQGMQFFNVGYAAAIGNVTILFIAVMATVLILLVRRADARINGK